MRHVYLDHAATTPLDPRVFEAMIPYLKEHFGNASSVHTMGRKARFAVEESREKIAALLGAEPGEIVFTSGGTEANNTALRGLLREKDHHMITSSVEHEAVLRPVEALEEEGYRISVLSPGKIGAVSVDQVRDALTSQTRLVSLMHANNEIGTLTPLREIADLCHEHNVVFHSDAVQTAGLFQLQVDDLGVGSLSISSHKFYGPKGVGVLYIRGGVDLVPLVLGGSQERRRRGGTENVAAIVGMATAFDLAVQEAESRQDHLHRLQQRLYEGLVQALGGAFVFNTPLDTGEVVPHIVNIAFPPVDGVPLDGEMLLLNLDLMGVYVSAGSACTSGAIEPSHVLLALGKDRETASAAIRFSIGKDTTEDDVDYAVDCLETIIRRMRKHTVSSLSSDR